METNFFMISRTSFLIVIVAFLMVAIVANAQTCIKAPDGMLAWWTGDGDGSDFWGNYHGAFINTSAYVAGMVDLAFDFNYNRNSWVQVEDNDIWNFGSSPFTIDLWVKFSQIIYRSPFIAHDVGGGPNDKWIFWYDASGHRYPGGPALRFHVFNPSGMNYSIDTVVFPWSPAVGIWYHVAVTKDGNTYNLYLDGANVKTESHAEILPNPSAPLTIGKAEAYRFSGSLDEIEIFNRALTPQEIKSIYEAGSAGKCKVITRNVEIDIKPGSEPNCINNNDHGVIPVAILGSSDFDASKIKPETLKLEGLAIKVAGKSNKLLAHLEDVNHDGFQDLLIQIQNKDGAFAEGTSIVTLTGNLNDGTIIEGMDEIRIVPMGSLGKSSGSIDVSTPKTFSLLPNYPNPFNPETTIQFYLPREAAVLLEIYNLAGGKITSLANGKCNSGYHSIRWDGKDSLKRPVAGGVYLCRMQAEEFSATIRLLLLK